MKILLTGAGGYLGRMLSSHWQGHELRLISGRRGFRDQLAQMPRVDRVVHLGFEVNFRPDKESENRNLDSARALVEFFRRTGSSQLVFVSAAGVMGVGAGERLRTEADYGQTDPGFEAYRDTAYILSKMKAEAIFREAGIPLTVCYPTTVFGPGLPTLEALRGRLVPPGGTSMIASRDFLRAMDILLAGSGEGERFLLNGGNFPFREIFRVAAEESGIKKISLPLPFAARPLLKIAARMAPALLAPAVLDSAFGYKYYSPQSFCRRYGWAPRVTLAEAVREAGQKKGTPEGAPI